MEATSSSTRNYEAIEAEFVTGVHAILSERWQAAVLALENQFAGEETERNFAILEQDVHDFFCKRNFKGRRPRGMSGGVGEEAEMLLVKSLFCMCVCVLGWDGKEDCDEIHSSCLLSE